MDPRDRGEMTDDPARKRMRAYLPVDWDPDRWRGTGLPDWIERMMQRGVEIRWRQPVVDGAHKSLAVVSDTRAVCACDSRQILR